ncbi:MAG: hypothetical protein E7558_00125 [Ruminococcaceae bacterium]|nr:hypothetical protein [Oscillospiraceae bacterium]
MNIIETMRTLLLEFPKINEVCNHISVDFTDDTEENYGLTSTGDILLKEDILGNETRQHNFILYAVFQSVTDYDRMNNSGTLLELQQWLETQADNGIPVTAEIAGETFEGEIESITPSNGMLYAIPNENNLDLVRYQLQISAIYKIYKE